MSLTIMKLDKFVSPSYIMHVPYSEPELKVISGSSYYLFRANLYYFHTFSMINTFLLN